MIDLRSDTVTRPTPAMRAFIAAAEVGDDVWSEDPTINKLETRSPPTSAGSAMYVPSGTMSNQRDQPHTQPGDELLCEETNHIYVWEAGRSGRAERRDLPHV